MDGEPKNAWNPELEFLYATGTSYMPIYGYYKKSKFYFNTQSHEAHIIENIIVTFSCNFVFQTYPFDEHYCLFNFGCVNANAKALKFNPLNMTRENGEVSASFDWSKVKNQHLTFDIWIQPINTSISYHYERYGVSNTGVTIYLKRNKRMVNKLLGEFFLPTSIYACFSWISFFIDPDIVPGRMGLLVTLFLISSNVYNSVTAPSDRGFSYLEMWLIGVQGPIVLAIVEYGFILAWKKRLSMKVVLKMGEYICIIYLYSIYIDLIIS